MVQNLLANAWKFTRSREQARITFAPLPAQGGHTCCYVRDNGAGFDAAYASKLFRPFQRLRSANELPGTGIGLATVRRIIERHGGRAWAESGNEGGAAFFSALPAADTTQQARAPAFSLCGMR